MKIERELKKVNALICSHLIILIRTKVGSRNDENAIPNLKHENKIKKLENAKNASFYSMSMNN